jgi:hypothetical protein
MNTERRIEKAFHEQTQFLAQQTQFLTQKTDAIQSDISNQTR